MSGVSPSQPLISYAALVSVAMEAAYQGALNAAGITEAALSCMDIYSCFPVAVFAACDALGIETTEGSTEDAGFWFAMFAVCAVAFRTLTSPMKAIAVLIHPPLGDDDHP